MDCIRYRKKLEVFLSFAASIETLSCCKRHSVGVVICPTDFSQVYSVGFNGPASGLPNEYCTGELGKCGCSHAEINALVKLRMDIWPSLMLSTVQPCFNCSNAIINNGGIIGIVYIQDCRHRGVRDMLEHVNIPCTALRELDNDTLSKWWSISPKIRRASIVKKGK